jgi:hypothetical protein
MLRIATGLVLFGAVAGSAWALPDDVIDRAVVCSVYGGFAPEADPRTAPARAAIDATVQNAIDQGLRTPEQVSQLFSEHTQLAIDDEPREELIANWNECRASFAP